MTDQTTTAPAATQPDQGTAPADRARAASPFHQPVSPDRRAADVASARANTAPSRVSAPSAAEWHAIGPQQRFAFDQSAARKADPWTDPTRVLRRDASGAAVQGEKAPDRARAKPTDAEWERMTYSEKLAYSSQPADAAGDKPGEKAGDEPAADASGKKYQIGEGESAIHLTADEARQFVVDHAEWTARKAAVPETPDGYQLKLPADFSPPQGVEFRLDQKDPVLADARAFAHSAGLDQRGFERMLSLHAQNEIRKLSEAHEMIAGEVKKLGPLATSRVTAIQQFIRGTLGDELAKPFIDTMFYEPQVRGWERIAAIVRDQGIGRFPGAHREPPEMPSISDEKWAGMSYSARKEYAARATGGRRG